MPSLMPEEQRRFLGKMVKQARHPKLREITLRRRRRAIAPARSKYAKGCIITHDRRGTLILIDKKGHAVVIKPVRTSKRPPCASSPRRESRAPDLGQVCSSCAGCGTRVWLITRSRGQKLGIRCLYCIRVFCFPCARKHFSKKGR